ncbi:MAG: twitching motility protein PilT [Lachnospiraceae bacterium]|nr:twitching motility protein PilT [Lachnospiraceae bacterium]
MVEIVCGEKGKGKTKIMLQKANEAVQSAEGSVVYIDKNSKHMYELNNDIRLVDISEYPITNFDGILGFVCGLLSGNHDIETVYMDSFLTISAIEKDTLVDAIGKLQKLNDEVKFVISISLGENEMPNELRDNIVAAC